jgi:hypothetical protein
MKPHWRIGRYVKPLNLALVPIWSLGLLPQASGEDAILRTAIDGVEINLWIPAGVTTLRGAIVDPANPRVGSDPANSSVAVWEETFRELDCAHIGMILKDMNRGNRPAILHGALIAALAEFSEKSGHREIESMPLCFAGMSRGGGWSVSTAFRMPERAVAYVSVVGWIADPKSEEALLRIPGLFVIGGVPDAFKMLDAIPKDYDPGRRRGALWALALQWGAAHDWNNADGLVVPFLDDLFHLRVPAPGAPAGGRVELKALKPEDGWLGDRSTWDGNFAAVAPWADYRGDRAAAVWLPDRKLAFLWRSFVSKDPPVRIEVSTSDGKAKLPAVPKRSMVVEAGSALVLETAIGEGTDVRKVTFYDGEATIGEAAGQPWKAAWEKPPSGPHGVFAMWEAHSGARGVSNPALVVVRKRPNGSR